MYSTTRAEVMEKGVAIEGAVSGILGFILDIDVVKSKSLGHQSTALSLNAKVNLLTDLKFVPKEIARQFQLFTEIRNKFAHIQEVDSYVKCFEIIKDQKKYLIETFAKHVPQEFDEEAKLNTGFTFLCFHLGMWMNLILGRSHHLKIQELKKTTLVELLRSYMVNSTPEQGSEEEKKIMDQVDILVKEIEQDKDFMASVVEAVKSGEKKS